MQPQELIVPFVRQPERNPRQPVVLRTALYAWRSGFRVSRKVTAGRPTRSRDPIIRGTARPISRAGFDPHALRSDRSQYDFADANSPVERGISRGARGLSARRPKGAGCESLPRRSRRYARGRFNRFSRSTRPEVVQWEAGHRDNRPAPARVRRSAIPSRSTT